MRKLHHHLKRKSKGLFLEENKKPLPQSLRKMVRGE
jgi:hypothetical protein